MGIPMEINLRTREAGNWKCSVVEENSRQARWRRFEIPVKRSKRDNVM